MAEYRGQHIAHPRKAALPSRGREHPVDIAEHKGFSKPDEVRTFEKGRIELIHIAGGVVGKATFEPGWQWSKHVKPIANTEWCLARHFGYHISGRIRIRMATGEEFELGPGEVSSLPVGHDAWVVGTEPVVMIDWSGASSYAKPSRESRH